MVSINRQHLVPLVAVLIILSFAVQCLLNVIKYAVDIPCADELESSDYDQKSFPQAPFFRYGDKGNKVGCIIQNIVV